MTQHYTIPIIGHPDQHAEAISTTTEVKFEVTTSIFDDKIRKMGQITVTGGKISINLHPLPSMVTEEGTRDFVIASIAAGLKACWDAAPKTFDVNQS